MSGLCQCFKADTLAKSEGFDGLVGHRMAQDMKFQCACGALSGVVEAAGPKTGHHVACYCKDCRAFVRHLRQDARFPDAAGGTDLFQTSPARVKLTEGGRASGQPALVAQRIVSLVRKLL